MFSVSEAEAASIRAAFERGGEIAAGDELRRLFPAIHNHLQARRMAVVIAGWKPLPPIVPRTTRRYLALRAWAR